MLLLMTVSSSFCSPGDCAFEDREHLPAVLRVVHVVLDLVTVKAQVQESKLAKKNNNMMSSLIQLIRPNNGNIIIIMVLTKMVMCVMLRVICENPECRMFYVVGKDRIIASKKREAISFAIFNLQNSNRRN
jgi:hypothetical protein